MAATILDQERAAFELVARNNPHFSDCHTFTVSDGFDAYDEPDVQAAFEIWQAARRAAPAGWKLVPVEPTRKMYEETWETKQYVAFDRFVDDYDFMLAAAPDFKEGAE